MALNLDSLENLQVSGKVKEDQEGEEGARLARLVPQNSERACKHPGVDSTASISVKCLEVCCSGQDTGVGGCAAMANRCRSGRKLFLPREVGRDVGVMLCSWVRRNTEVTQRPKYQEAPHPRGVQMISLKEEFT